jgi:hypothetical protein
METSENKSYVPSFIGGLGRNSLPERIRITPQDIEEQKQRIIKFVKPSLAKLISNPRVWFKHLTPDKQIKIYENAVNGINSKLREHPFGGYEPAIREAEFYCNRIIYRAFQNLMSEKTKQKIIPPKIKYNCRAIN